MNEIIAQDITDLARQDEQLTPIEQLPEGLIVLLKCGYSRFYGYRLGEKFYHQNHEEHIGIVSPSEFRRLTGYEKTIMGRGEQ
jgi:hypothetical protein